MKKPRGTDREQTHCEKQMAYRLLSIPVSLSAVLFVYFFNIPNPMMVLIIPVVLFAYLDGYLGGLLSGCMAIAYSVYFFFFATADRNAAAKLATIVLAVSSIVLLVGKLKDRDKQIIDQLTHTHTDLVEARDRAEKLSRTKSDFLSRMSHEIRTPMNAIIGFTGIAMKSNDSQKSQEYLSKINDASIHLLGLINDILDMSKIEAGKFELDLEDFSLEQMLKRVVNINQYLFDQKNQDFIITIGPDVPPSIVTDQQRLSQVITNLLSNAAKFTPVGGKISLSIALLAADKDTATIRFEVKDEGIGMTKEQISRLFQSFEQADSSISRRFGGTGLGLAISKAIVEMMDGTIWAESVPGQGSCLTFNIRVKKGVEGLGRHPQCLPPNLSSAATDKNIFGGYCMLLVEDIEINREIIKAIVEPTGITVAEAENGRVACEKFEQEPERFDLIVMDVHMPEMDGYTATRTIREMKQTAQSATVPILAMTANVFKEDVEHCLAVGMNDHLGKPVDAAKLIHKMKRLLLSQ